MSTKDVRRFAEARSAWQKMTAADCVRIGESFEFRGGLLMWSPKLTVEAIDEGLSVKAVLEFTVPSRDGSGKVLTVGAAETWALSSINQAFITFEKRIAVFVRGVVQHEVHESIWAGGRQLFDPHDARREAE